MLTMYFKHPIENLQSINQSTNQSINQPINQLTFASVMLTMYSSSLLEISLTEERKSSTWWSLDSFRLDTWNHSCCTRLWLAFWQTHKHRHKHRHRLKQGYVPSIAATNTDTDESRVMSLPSLPQTQTQMKAGLCPFHPCHFYSKFHSSYTDGFMV